MINKTRRTLDTCNCRVVYEWDSDLPLEQIVHTVSKYEYKCPDHENVSGIISDQDLYDNVVCKENGKKNQSFDMLLQNGPSSIYDLTPEGTKVFKKGISVSWSFTGIAPNRKLTITISGINLTANQIAAIQTKLNEKFGINDVVITNG